METPTDEPTEDERPTSETAGEGDASTTGDAPVTGQRPEEGGGSYEDRWYQVLKRRSQDKKPGDEQNQE